MHYDYDYDNDKKQATKSVLKTKYSRSRYGIFDIDKVVILSFGIDKI